LSITRLLLLGAIRIFQPVHGYFIRRELITWQVDQWANLHPGSIYNGLRSLVKDGLIEAVGVETIGSRPARTVYRLTAEGDDEFLRLLRDAVWRFEPFQAGMLQAGLSMMPYLSRAEVTAAMRHRLGLLEGFLTEATFGIESMRASVATPDHVAEQILLIMGRVKGEIVWTNDFLARLEDGSYRFSGEELPDGTLH
jgi:DNA-binding PadR family transcriptional regulator